MVDMELFDTHAHFSGSAAEMAGQLARARTAGVTRIMAVGGSDELNAGAIQAATGWRALGWDRDQVGKDLPPIDYSDVSAVGEIGLDYHYQPGTRRDQLALMARQLELARTLDLPVVIHTREAEDDTLGLLHEIPSRGIIHCFTGGRQFCGRLLDLGFYISFSGIVTFKAAENVRESARFVPDDRILIETDSPYLAPVPERGRANEPAFLVHTARFLAALRDVPIGIFAEQTVKNSLFALIPPGKKRIISSNGEDKAYENRVEGADGRA